MPKYRITAPDGATYEVTAPDDATPEQVQSYVQQSAGSLKPVAPQGPSVSMGTQAGTQTASGPTAEQRYLSNPLVRLAKGGKDSIDGLAQLASRIPGADAVNSAADAAGRFLNRQVFNRIGLPGDFAGEVLGIRGATPQQLDKEIRDANTQYEEARRATAPKSITSLVTGQPSDPGFDWMRLAGNVASPTNALIPGGALKNAVTIPQLALAGAKAGAFGAATQPVMDSENFWAAKGLQTAAGALGGALFTPALAKGTELGMKAVRAASDRMRPPGAVINGQAVNAATPEQLNVAVNRLLESQGATARDMPEAVLNSVRAQIQDAVAARSKLDPAAALRRAQAEAIGMTGDAALTNGQLLRDPMRFAQEKNLSGVRIDTPNGPTNPLADKFTAQNQALQGVFDQAGARGATNPAEAAAPIMDALRRSDEPVRAGVDKLYEAARAMNAGRAAELDPGAFSQAVNAELDRGMWGRFVPPEAREFVNDITAGKVPFTVETAVTIDSRLGELQRKAQRAGDDAAASALGIIRTQLQKAPFAAPAAEVRAPGVAEAAYAAGVVDNGVTDVPFREMAQRALPGRQALPAPPGRAVATAADFEIPSGVTPGTALATSGQPAAAKVNPGEAARQAFEEARRAARSRFATIEDTPALKAALNEEAPDDFVRKYIINGKAEDLKNLRKVLENSPEALSQVRAQIAAHLKRAGFGDNLSGDAPFAASRFSNALRNIGPERLKAFFSPEEVMRFNLAAKVGSDLESIPAGARYAVNRSGSGAAVFNLLQGLTQMPGIGKVPGIGWARDQVGKMQSEAALRAAVQPGSAVMPATQAGSKLTPEQVRALSLLFAPPAVGVGAAVGSNF